jgi:hypothetical protein
MEKLLHFSALPLLVSLAAFSSKDRFPDHEITIVSSWLLLFVFACIFFHSFKYKNLAIILITAVIILRVINIFTLSVQLVYLSSFLFLPLVIVSSICIVLKNNEIFIRQIIFFTLISIVISLLQIHGVVLVQKFGSGADWKVLSDVPLLFVEYTEYFWAGMTQTRPDGITHANNLTSQILLFFYAWLVTFNISQLKEKFSSKFLILIISFGCAINAGKVIIFGIGCLFIFILTNNTNMKMKIFLNIIIPTFLGYALYAILYPGLFILNFDLSVFFINAIGRIINLGVIADNTLFLAIGEYLSQFEVDGVYSIDSQLSTLKFINETSDTFSGLGSVINFLSIIFPILFVIIILWKKAAHRLNFLYIKNIKTVIGGILVISIASIFGGPFITTIWYVFFSSIVLTPIIIPWLSVKFLKSINYRCSDDLIFKKNNFINFNIEK